MRHLDILAHARAQVGRQPKIIFKKGFSSSFVVIKRKRGQNYKDLMCRCDVLFIKTNARVFFSLASRERLPISSFSTPQHHNITIMTIASTLSHDENNFKSNYIMIHK